MNEVPLEKRARMGAWEFQEFPGFKGCRVSLGYPVLPALPALPALLENKGLKGSIDMRVCKASKGWKAMWVCKESKGWKATWVCKEFKA